MEIGDRVLKDGQPGTLTGWGDGEEAADILLDSGRSTFVRHPGTNPRLQFLGGPMTEEEKRLARHALGLPNPKMQSYRNYYAAVCDSEVEARWESLCHRWYSVVRPLPRPVAHATLRGFTLTLAGAKAALEPGESLDREDFPEARS